MVFLFVGLAVIRKGVLDLLDAWELAGRPGRLVLVGDADSTVAPYLAAAVESGSVEHVTYTDDVGAHYRSADVLVVPTFEEGGPQVTLEAGGLGVPVIATSMGSARLVEHGRNGLIIRPGEPEELADAIVRVAEDSDMRHRLARRIREDARAFTYEKVSAWHADVLVSALSPQEV